jgi:hypothetical protein
MYDQHDCCNILQKKVDANASLASAWRRHCLQFIKSHQVFSALSTLCIFGLQRAYAMSRSVYTTQSLEQICSVKKIGGRVL